MIPATAIDQDFEQFREPLQCAGKSRLRGRLVSKIDIEGVVQETFLEAFQQADSWRSDDPAVRAVWIRRAFQNNLVDEIRRFRRQSRDGALEWGIDDGTRGRAGSVATWLTTDEPSPHEVVVQREHAKHLSAALARLPDVQRKAVELHHLRGLTLAEVAKQLNRTKGAVAGLIYRGLQKLRVLLQELIMVEA